MADRGWTRRWAGVALAVLVLHLALIQPNHPAAFGWAALRFLPHELPLILLALATLPRRARPALRVAITAFLTLMATIKLADLAAHLAYGRSFNAIFDLHLLPAGRELAEGAIGRPATLAVMLGAGAGLAALAAALWWATGRIAALAPPRATALLLLPAVALVAAGLARPPALALPGEPFTLRLAIEHTRAGILARRNLADFRDEAARDAHAATPADALMGALRDHDVLILFAESYGRTALDNPRYAPTIRATLAEAEAELARAGLAARSAFLASPVVGGQSWLAHATLLSGLEIDTQGRYRALTASARATLVSLAGRAGWRTAAVMPAITRAWPEADYFGYEILLDRDRLGYRGLPFNWVTMPDQFTLAAFERQLLGPAPRAPVFAEIALISSHAPWTPIPPRLPWEALGDGRIFDPYATAGDPPAVVWRDQDRVRDQFRQALAYTLATALDFTARRADTPALTLLLGDHQPAAFVNEGHGGTQVPVHLIGPPDLIARTQAWGWTPGLLPAPDAPAWPMQDLRDRFLDAFAGAPCGELPRESRGQPLRPSPSC